jgi:RNA polymerase sigma factor (sigma-70 family)
VRRHGGLVLGVARRHVPDRQQAEDVFQATFLALARQSARLGRPPSLTNWLYTVALRQARKARAAAARRAALLDRLASPPHAPADPLAEITGRELVAVIDDELARLPEAYRLPLLLCGLQGLARDEAARQLGWPAGSVKGRLERGRELLRKRLASRGLTVPAVLAGSLVADGANAVPPALVRSTARAALAVLTAPAAWGSLPALAAAIALFTLGTGAGLAVLPGGRSDTPAPQQPPPAPPPAAPAGRVDHEGVPLPPGALARLGSSRLRSAGLISVAAFARDGKTFATGGTDGIRIWDTATGKVLRRLGNNEGWIHVGGYSADGREMICLTIELFRYTVQRLDPISGAEWSRVELAKKEYEWGVLSRSGRRIAVFRDDQTVRLYDTATGRETLSLPLPNGWPPGIEFSPDDALIAIADVRGALPIYDTATGQRTFELPQKAVVFVTFTPDGRGLAAITEEEPPKRVVVLWDLTTRTVRHRLRADGTFFQPSSVCFSPDGTRLVTGGSVSESILWDAATGREIRRFPTLHGAIRATFSPDGRTLAASSNRGTITLWDVETGRLLPASASPPSLVQWLRPSADGRRWIGFAGGVIAWDPADGREVSRSSDVPAAYGVAACSPDERLIAYRDGAGGIRLMDAATGRVVRTLGEGKHFAFALEFTPDGRRLLASDNDHTIVIWDVAGGQEVGKLIGHRHEIGVLAVSPDGQQVATASADAKARDDDAIRLWDLTTFREVRQFSPRRWAAFGLAFSPDGRRLASAGGELGLPNSRGEVQLWDVHSGRELRSFEDHAERVGRRARPLRLGVRAGHRPGPPACGRPRQRGDLTGLHARRPATRLGQPRPDRPGLGREPGRGRPGGGRAGPGRLRPPLDRTGQA